MTIRKHIAKFPPDYQYTAESFDDITDAWSSQTTFGSMIHHALMRLEYSLETKHNIAYGPDGKSIAVAHGNNIHIFSRQNASNSGINLHKELITLLKGKDVSLIALKAKLDTLQVCTLVAHTDLVQQLIYSIDGRYLCTSSADGMKIWNLATNSLVCTLETAFYQRQSEYGTITGCVCFSPSNKQIAVETADLRIKICDANTGSVLKVLSAPKSMEKTYVRDEFGLKSKLQQVECFDHIRSLTYSADGILLAAGTDKGYIHVWNVLTGKLLWTYKKHDNPFISVVFSPDTDNDTTRLYHRYIEME